MIQYNSVPPTDYTLATWTINSTDSLTVKTMNNHYCHCVFLEFCHIFVLILVLIITLIYIEIEFNVLNSCLKVQVPSSYELV